MRCREPAVSGVKIGMSVSRDLDTQFKANYHSLKMNTGTFRHLENETVRPMELTISLTFSTVARLAASPPQPTNSTPCSPNVTQRVKALEARSAPRC